VGDGGCGCNGGGGGGGGVIFARGLHGARDCTAHVLHWQRAEQIFARIKKQDIIGGSAPLDVRGNKVSVGATSVEFDRVFLPTDDITTV
jgi:hypothetical protein